MSPTRPSADFWRWLSVGVGVALRVVPWVRNPPLWQDEAALVLNVTHLDFADYCGPLLHHQAAPPLFLVMERAAFLTLGDSEAALRLPVLFLGCVSLILFAVLARRILEPIPAAVAVALFGVSDRLIWHATEVKPYAADALVAVAVAWGYVHTRAWTVTARCGLWAVVLPVVVWFSYPTGFVAGGLLVALLPDALQSRWPGRLAYLLAVVGMGGSFAALAMGPAHAQRDAALAGYWVGQLADWRHPLRVPVWAVGATLEVDRYALIPLGQLLLPLALVGTIRMARSDGRLLTALLAPVALAMVAGLLRRYPYGGGRVDVFLAPAYILLVAAGLPVVWEWMWAHAPPAVLIVIGLLLVPVGQIAYRTAVPRPRPDFREPVAFVLRDGEPADAISGDHWELLYYTRHHADRYLRLAEIGVRRPARVWVLTGTDPGVTEAVLSQVPPDWHRVESRTFHGTTAILMERRP